MPLIFVFMFAHVFGGSIERASAMRKQRSYNPEGRGLFVSIAVRRDVAYIVYGCDAAQHWQENSQRDAALLGIGAHGLVEIGLPASTPYTG
jgi:hypothetical protein